MKSAMRRSHSSDAPGASGPYAILTPVAHVLTPRRRPGTTRAVIRERDPIVTIGLRPRDSDGPWLLLREQDRSHSRIYQRRPPACGCVRYAPCDTTPSAVQALTASMNGSGGSIARHRTRNCSRRCGSSVAT